MGKAHARQEAYSFRAPDPIGIRALLLPRFASLARGDLVADTESLGSQTAEMVTSVPWTLVLSPMSALRGVWTKLTLVASASAEGQRPLYDIAVPACTRSSMLASRRMVPVSLRNSTMAPLAIPKRAASSALMRTLAGPARLAMCGSFA